MEPFTLPEPHDMNYADYIDAIRREEYLKSLKRSGTGSGPSRNRLGKDAVNSNPTNKSELAADHAQ